MTEAHPHGMTEGRIDAGYVREILAEARIGMTRDEFRAFVQRDRDAGWHEEAHEAERLYFAPTASMPGVG